MYKQFFKQIEYVDYQLNNRRPIRTWHSFCPVDDVIQAATNQLHSSSHQNAPIRARIAV